MSANKRIAYLDYAKGIGILLVMLAHSIQYFRPMAFLYRYIYGFNISIFFVASGCLAYYRREKSVTFAEFMRKRAKALLVPYVYFSVFNFILKLSVLTITHSITVAVLKDELIRLVITGNGTAWFLTTLFAVEVFLWLFKKSKLLYSRIVVLSGAVIFLVLPYLINAISCNPFGKVLLRVLSGIGYCLTGYLIAVLYEALSIKLTVALSALLFAVGTISYCFTGVHYNFFNADFKKTISSLTISICLSFATLLFCMALDNGEIHGRLISSITFYGKNSLVVMLIHPIILNLVTYVFIYRPSGSVFHALPDAIAIGVSLVLFVAIAVVQVPIATVINKRLPWLIGKGR